MRALAGADLRASLDVQSQAVQDVKTAAEADRGAVNRSFGLIHAHVLHAKRDIRAIAPAPSSLRMHDVCCKVGII